MKKVGIIAVIFCLMYFSSCNLFIGIMDVLGNQPQIKIIPENQKIKVGESCNIKAIYSDVDGQKDVTHEANWQISESSIAELTSDGKVTGFKPGEARISVNYKGLSAESDYYFITEDQLWLSFFGGAGSEKPSAIIKTSDGGFLIVGSGNAEINPPDGSELLHPFSGSNDMLILKLTKNGQYQWHSFFGGSIEDSAQDVIECHDGSFLILGMSFNNIATAKLGYHSDGDMILLKISSSGKKQWHSYIGEIGAEKPAAIAEANDGDIIVLGTANSSWNETGGEIINSYHNNSDIIVVKLNSEGEKIIWYNFLGSDANEVGVDMAMDNNGFIYIYALATQTFGNPMNPYQGVTDSYLCKMNSDGEIKWESFYGTPTEDTPKCLTVTDESIFISASTKGDNSTSVNSSGGAGKNILVSRISKEDGSVLWSNTVGGAFDDIPFGIMEMPDKGILVTASSSANFGNPLNSYSGGSLDVLLVKFDLLGQQEWHTFYGGLGDEIPVGVVNAENNGIVIAGFSSQSFGTPILPFAGGAYDFFVAHFLASGICP